MLVFRAGDYVRARDALEEGIQVLRATGGTKDLPPALIFNGIVGTALGRLGSLALLKGNLPDAKRLLEKSLALFTDLGARWDIAWALTHLGKVAIAANDWDEAERALKQALKISLEAQALPQAIEAALELANCFLQRGALEQAAELVLPALNHPASTDLARQRAAALKEILAQQEVKTIPARTLEESLARYAR
jgi:tetratricopeptide (TPR) repeat protein